MKIKIIGMMMLLACLGFAVWSCEPDDLCEHQTVTPRLVMRSYSASSPTDVSPVNNLLVYGGGSTTALSYASLDSLALPLKVNTTETTFVMVKNAVYNTTTGEIASGSVATITFSYDIENEFVSKGCGFKSVFKNLTATVADAATSWITDVKIINSTVENESDAKIHIYH